ncbi:MAG: hypothetical protein VZR53_10095 [Prevotella sp.]|nr:hypothetical protein [Prevotella sp.]
MEQQIPFDEDIKRFQPTKIDAIVNPDGHTLYVLYFDANSDAKTLSRSLQVYANSIQKSKVLKDGDSVITLPNNMSLKTQSVEQLESLKDEISNLIIDIKTNSRCRYYHDDGSCWGTQERDKFGCKGDKEFCPQNS